MYVINTFMKSGIYCACDVMFICWRCVQVTSLFDILLLLSGFGADCLQNYVRCIKAIEKARHEPSIVLMDPTYFCRQSVPDLISVVFLTFPLPSISYWRYIRI